MGGQVSSGANNSELVDNLVKQDYINNPAIEKVFRAVDRGDFYLPENRRFAYKDMAWKHVTYHLSSPCIYAEVLDALQIEEGCSFLNMGSGIGYLSTMAGLLIGSRGLNHGIEIHAKNVSYAQKKIQEFITKNPSFDQFDFCVPNLVVGNCLLIDRYMSNELKFRLKLFPSEYLRSPNSMLYDHQDVESVEDKIIGYIITDSDDDSDYLGSVQNLFDDDNQMGDEQEDDDNEVAHHRRCDDNTNVKNNCSSLLGMDACATQAHHFSSFTSSVAPSNAKEDTNANCGDIKVTAGVDNLSGVNYDILSSRDVLERGSADRNRLNADHHVNDSEGCRMNNLHRKNINVDAMNKSWTDSNALHVGDATVNALRLEDTTTDALHMGDALHVGDATADVKESCYLMRYDRVYVGCAVPASYLSYVQQFVKVGGFLILPFNDTLVKLRRVSEYE